MSDDELSVAGHLRQIQRRPDEQRPVRRVPLSSASVSDHLEQIQSHKTYGVDRVELIADDDTGTPDREDD